MLTKFSFSMFLMDAFQREHEAMSKGESHNEKGKPMNFARPVDESEDTNESNIEAKG